MSEHSVLAIALRDGISVSEVLTLLQHWCQPLMWEFARCLELATRNDPTWQAWRVHHEELIQRGYYR